MEDYVDFEKTFRNLIEKHKEDPDYNLIKDYPVLYSIVANIASDKNSCGIVKMIMNSAISYFILPTDVISEKDFGIKGYLDDFFICLHALTELLKYDKKLGEYLISKYWTLEENYNNYLSDKYYKLLKMIEPNLRSKIISYSGINFIEEMIMSKKSPRKYSEKKIRDLQRKIHYMFYLFLNRPIVGKEGKREFDGQFFGTKEFMEFSKKIDLLSKNDDEFKYVKNNLDRMFNLENKIKEIKVKRLLK